MNNLHLIDQSLSILSKKKEIFIREDYVWLVKEYTETRNTVILQWMRRVWKSFVILWFLLGKWIDIKKVFYLNKEKDIKNEIKDVKDLSDLFDSFLKDRWKPEYIIIDEVQDITNWESFIRSMSVGKEYKIIISWSNSKLLNSDLTTYLAWRFLDIFVWPLSFNEYKKIIDFAWKKLDNLLLDYLTYWGLPETVLISTHQAKKNYTKNALDTVIFRDIIKRYNIKDVNLLDRLLQYIAETIGSILSARKITDFLKSNGMPSLSNTTLTTFIKHLEDTYIINKIRRYDMQWKRILESKEKYFFTDIGIRNSLWFDLSKDIWKLLENVVYLHLRSKWYEVCIWELKGLEIDFIAKKDNKIVYIQVAYLIPDEEVRDREFGNLLKVKNNHRKFVVSMDEIASGNNEGIEWMNIKTFLETFE